MLQRIAACLVFAATPAVGSYHGHNTTHVAAPRTGPAPTQAAECLYTHTWLPKANPAVLLPLYFRAALIGYDAATDTCTDTYFLAVARGCHAVVAVVNPFNGPLPDGDKALPALRACMRELGRRGVRMVGYVHTKDTGKDPTTGVWKPTAMREQWLVKGDMDRWVRHTEGVVGFAGFFLDDTTNYYQTVTNWQGWNHVWWYQQLIIYAKITLPDATVVLNPGSFVHLDLVTPQPAMPHPADISIPFETYAYKWRPPGDDCGSVQASSQFGSFGPGPWCANMPKADRIEPFIEAVNNRTITVAAVVHSASKEFAFREAQTAWQANMRYFYATDRTLEPPNDPWDGVPSFWDEYLTFLDRAEETVAPVGNETDYGGGGVNTTVPSSGPRAAPGTLAVALLVALLLLQ